jgi:restriction system protein
MLWHNSRDFEDYCLEPNVPTPSKKDILLPLLEYASQHERFNIDDAIDALAEHFHLSEAERREMLASGKAKRFNIRVMFARLDLCMAGLIESSGRKTLAITTAGKDVIAKRPKSIDRKFLMQFPGYADVINARRANNKAATQELSAPDDLENPEETLEAGYQLLRKDLANALLEKLVTSSPSFFERVVVDLLVAMGYGGSRKDAGEAVGRSGDDGIDGIIKEDKLGLDAIYIQAKRYSEANVVGRPAVQNFAGSLEGNRARKGVFITTSRFSKDAEDYVCRIEKKIILIDGSKLAELMIDHGVGVSETAHYIIKKIDNDYFEELD